MIFSHIAVYIGSRKKYQIISLCHEHNAQHMSTIQMKFLRFILTVDQVSQPSHGHRHHYARPIPKRHMRHPVTRPPIRITTWKLYSLCNEMNRSTLRQGGLFKRQRTEVLEDAVYSCTEYVFGHFSPGKAWLQSRFGPEHTEWGDSQNLIPDYTIETNICWKGANPNAWWNCQGWNHHGFAREKKCERMARLSPK